MKGRKSCILSKQKHTGTAVFICELNMLQRRAKDDKLTRERLCWLGSMTTKLNRIGVFKSYLGSFQVGVRLATRCISIESAGSEINGGSHILLAPE